MRQIRSSPKRMTKDTHIKTTSLEHYPKIICQAGVNNLPQFHPFRFGFRNHQQQLKTRDQEKAQTLQRISAETQRNPLPDNNSQIQFPYFRHKSQLGRFSSQVNESKKERSWWEFIRHHERGKQKCKGKLFSSRAPRRDLLGDISVARLTDLQIFSDPVPRLVGFGQGSHSR